MGMSDEVKSLLARAPADFAVDEILEGYDKLCRFLFRSGHPVQAAKFARHAQELARARYRRGQVGYDKFSEYLR
jgi:hypothetical protein